ncbi:MAG: PIG-L family deacetylase, partial [Myxococcales bacterium]|nr:PIG-L family deacetylase [Myxococcales bacterium]
MLIAPSLRAAPREIDPPSAGRLRLALERLSTVGTVLYVAAHPDDENTRLLAWLAGERKVRVAYAALTRGDGGQNLVGAELGPLLGLVRTHELLAARAIDGAEQWFTRAIDFGYSKSAEEALRIWGKDAILADLVRIIRTVRPDVIVTRFDDKPPNHGHHTASAILAREAFTAAADASRFPGGPAPFQARYLLENKSSWRFTGDEDLSVYLSVDTGTYSPLLGVTYSAIAAASRTMHKSQGFGTAATLGPAPEYFEVTATAPGVAAPTKDPFEGVATSWARFPKTGALEKALAAAEKALDPEHPEAALPALARVRAELLKLPDDNPAKAEKLAEVEALLVGAAGLVLAPRAEAEAVVPGVASPVTASIVANGAGDVVVNGITWPDGARDGAARKLAKGALVTASRDLTMPAGTPFSTPFWLAEPPTRAAGGGPPALFSVKDADLAIRPVGPPDLPVVFDVTIGGARFDVVR